MLNIGSSSSVHLYSPTIRVVVAISMALTISHEQMTEISSEPQNHLPSLKDSSHTKLNMWYVRAQSCPTLCNPMDCSLPGSSVHRNLQARILEWVASPPSGDLPNLGMEPGSFMSPAFAGGFFTTSTTWEVQSL